MERSESIKELAVALCRFQQEVGKIRKTANNPFFKSKYATLADILDVIQEPLSAAGLAVMQLPSGENELETIVMHVSGEYITSRYTMKPVKADPQGIGSCITYQRRYALGAALNLNIDDDDDGNHASGNLPKQATQNSNRKKILTPEHLKNPETVNKLCSWIYSNSEAAKKVGKRLSITSLLENSYQITQVEINTISELYNKYLKQKSL